MDWDSPDEEEIKREKLQIQLRKTGLTQSYF